MSTRKKAVTGIFWTFTDAVLVKGFSLLSLYILARLLSPEDYGLLAILMIFINIGNTIVESGLSNSLIRTNEPTQLDYSTVFWMNVCTGVIFYILLFISIPGIVAYLDKPIPVDALRISCLSIVIASLTTVQMSILTKEMKFKTLMIANIPAAILSPAIGVAMAYYGFGLWSLVAMILITPLGQGIVLWSISSWRPSWSFDMSVAKKHFNFGYKLLLSSLLDAVFKNIYSAIIAKRYNLISLGQFDRAQTLNSYPANILTTIVAKVTYPLLANIQNNKEEISNAYRQIIRMSLYISAPLMLGLAATAPSIIPFLLGDKYQEAIPYFQIICIASMLYPIHSINLNVLKVYGRTDLFLKLEVIKKVLTAICIAVAWNYGIIGLVWSSAIASVLSLLVNTYYSEKLIGYSTLDQLKEMIPTLTLSIGMYLFIVYVSQYTIAYPLILQILINFIAGFLLYGILSWLFKLAPFNFLLKTIKSYKL